MCMSYLYLSRLLFLKCWLFVMGIGIEESKFSSLSNLRIIWIKYDGMFCKYFIWFIGCPRTKIYFPQFLCSCVCWFETSRDICTIVHCEWGAIKFSYKLLSKTSDIQHPHTDNQLTVSVLTASKDNTENTIWKQSTSWKITHNFFCMGNPSDLLLYWFLFNCWIHQCQNIIMGWCLLAVIWMDHNLCPVKVVCFYQQCIDRGGGIVFAQVADKRYSSSQAPLSIPPLLEGSQ